MRVPKGGAPQQAVRCASGGGEAGPVDDIEAETLQLLEWPAVCRQVLSTNLRPSLRPAQRPQSAGCKQSVKEILGVHGK